MKKKLDEFMKRARPFLLILSGASFILSSSTFLMLLCSGGSAIGIIAMLIFSILNAFGILYNMILLDVGA